MQSTGHDGPQEGDNAWARDDLETPTFDTDAQTLIFVSSDVKRRNKQRPPDTISRVQLLKAIGPCSFIIRRYRENRGSPATERDERRRTQDVEEGMNGAV